RAAQTLDDILSVALETTLAAVKVSSGSIWLYDPILDKLDLSTRHGQSATGDAAGRLPAKPSDRMAGFAFATGQPYVSREYCLDPRLPESVRTAFPPGVGGAAMPIRAGDAVIGILDVDVTVPRELTADEVHLLTILTEIAGNAIQRTRLHDQTERRLQRLTSLSDIDRAIIGGFDLPRNLNILLDHVCARLSVDAADVLLFDAGAQVLEYAAGSGFQTGLSKHARLSIGRSQAGRAASERQPIHILNLQAAPAEFDPAFLAGEAFVEYYGVPLIAKGQVKGVMEVFHRAPLASDQEWLDFLNALAGQCAIAIDNATLFSGLQRSNSDLARAYDATIEGWSRALDLRDKETEGHTQRVTEMTGRLACAYGLTEEERVHIRRGALLHDIGKMGIPDSVLLKPGALTDEEWVIMRTHPRLAFDLLSPIEYLSRALEIPYCHHEKWDGTGYPRRWSGEQIPLGARLFAVADVWDALSSDRPYRPAWEADRVYEHIRSQSGIHFDPAAVGLFFQVISGNRE
ncbi:MAG TPA: HD domain-containing phosphohydrolase, partial [Anaerolineae bacterium]